MVASGHSVSMNVFIKSVPQKLDFRDMMKKADKLFEKEHMSYRSSSGNEETRYSYVVKALTDLIFMGQWCKRCARRTENP